MVGPAPRGFLSITTKAPLLLRRTSLKYRKVAPKIIFYRAGTRRLIAWSYITFISRFLFYNFKCYLLVSMGQEHIISNCKLKMHRPSLIHQYLTFAKGELGALGPFSPLHVLCYNHPVQSILLVLFRPSVQVTRYI